MLARKTGCQESTYARKTHNLADPHKYYRFVLFAQRILDDLADASLLHFLY